MKIFNNKHSGNFSKYIFYSFLILLAIISFLPYLLAQELGKYEIISAYNGFKYQDIKEYLYLWHSAYLGRFTSLFVPHNFYVLGIFELFPPYIAQTIIMGSVKFLAGLGIYFLLGNFTKNTYIRVLGSLYYLLSIYGQAITGNTLTGGYLFYAVLPYLVGFFISINAENRAKYLFYYVLLALLIIDTNLTYIFYLFMFFGLYSIYKIIVDRDFTRLGYVFVFGVLFILISQIYYLPFYAENYIFRNDVVATNLQAESATWKSSYSSIVEVMRLMGSLDFYDANEIGGKLLHSRPFFLYFANSLILLISALLSVFALLGLIVWKEKNTSSPTKAKTKYFYTGILLIFLFFSIGAHPSNPAKSIYEYLSSNLLLFNVFRDPYKSVSFINLIFSIGIVLIFNALVVRTKLYLTSIFTFIVLLLVVSQSYLVGDVYKKSELLQVPQYINEYADWNNNNREQYDSKKLILPGQPFPTLEFVVQEGKGSPILFQMMNSKAVQNNVTFTPYIESMQRSVYKPEFEKMLGFYNIPYAVNFKDIDYKVFKSENPEKIATKLPENMALVKTFGDRQQVQVYEVNNTVLNDTLYIPSRIVYVQNNKNVDKILNSVFTQQPDNDFAYIIRGSNKEVVIGKTPDMRIVSRSNIEFVVEFKNVRDNFLLVFNENFSNGWLLKKQDSILQSISVDHFIVNGFTNGYYIDVKNIRKQLGEDMITTNNDGSINFTLKLYYQPQYYLYAGIAITILTMLVAFVYYIKSAFTRRAK